MMQEGLYAYLTAGLSSSNIYPMMIPQTVYSEAIKKPCVVYSVDEKGRHVRFSGTDSLVQGRITLDCYATTYSAAQALAASVRALMVDYSGTWTGNGSPQSVTPVQTVFLENEIDLMDTEPGLFRVSQQYIVWYDEA